MFSKPRNHVREPDKDSIMAKHEHIVASGKDGKLKFKCYGCGISVEYDMPITVDAINNFGKVFNKEHKNCVKTNKT